MMLLAVRRLVLCLAIVAVGVAHIRGLRAGYLCDCTGRSSFEQTCETDECHPSLPHRDGCATMGSHASSTDHDEEESPAVPDDHEHSEIRATLIVAGVPPLLGLPAVILVELPPPFQAQRAFAPLLSLASRPRPALREDGSPPMPLLVARAVVRLV